MAYEEEDFLQLSGIQHFLFCRRQWALIHLEQQWSENLRTVDGQLLHQNAHDPELRTMRGDLLTVRRCGIPAGYEWRTAVVYRWIVAGVSRGV